MRVPHSAPRSTRLPDAAAWHAAARSLDGTFREKDFEISRTGVRFGVHGMARSASGGDLAILGDTDLWLPATATARPSDSWSGTGCGVHACARAQASFRAVLTQRACAELRGLLTPLRRAPQQSFAK